MKKFLFNTISGALLVLALPPFNVFPLAFLGLILLIYSLNKATNLRDAFLRGWLFGCGFFICGLYWMSVALIIDWPRFAWYMPLSLIGLPALFAIYIGLMAAVLHWLSQRTKYPPRTLALLFPIGWTLFEILRGTLFTGFPWNSLGYIWTDYPIAQIAAIFGVYGLSFITCVVASLLAIALVTRIAWYKREALVTMCFGIMCLLYAFGYQRIVSGRELAFPADNVRPSFHIVQPNIPQGQKWDTRHRAQNFQKLLSLSATAKPNSVIVWPETASPYILDDAPQARQAIGTMLRPDQSLVAGTLRNNGQTYFNSAEILDSSGTITIHYDKFHLVPFGEFMPLKKWLPFPAIANMFGSIGEGNGPQTLALHVSDNQSALKISPLICYEAIFPGQVTDHKNRPDVLVNITNDAWYGDSIGPYQHLAQAQMRAIEEGLPLMRAANTGISAAIDAYGNILVQTRFGMMADFDALLTPAVNPAPPAANGGFYKWLALLIIIYGGVIIYVLRQKPPAVSAKTPAAPFDPAISDEHPDT